MSANADVPPALLPPVEAHPEDVLEVLTWFADTVGTRLDAERAGEALGSAPLRLDTQAGARSLLRGVNEGGLSLEWRELRVRDIGRHRAWATVVPSSGTLLYAERVGWGRHQVRLVRDGATQRRSLRTAELATLLGVPRSGAVLGLAATPRLPLEQLRAPRANFAPWRRARALIRLDRDDAWLALVYGAAIGILSLATPIAVQSVVNTVSFGSVLQPLIVLTVLVAIVLTFSAVIRVFQAQVVEAMQARLFVRAVTDLSRRLLQVQRATLDRANTSDVTSRFLEIPVIQKSIAMLLVDGIDLLLKLIVGMLLLAFYHPLLLLFAIGLLASLALVVFLGGRGAVHTALDESSAKYAAASWMEHLVRMPDVMRSTTTRRWAIDRADRLARRYRDARARHFTKLLRQLVGGTAIKVIGSAALLGIGGALVLSTQLTLGQLVASELVFASIGIALVKLHKQLEAVYDLLASSAKLGALVDLPLERTGGELIPLNGPASLRLRDIEIGHTREQPLVRGASLELGAGERLVLEGAGGTGKSTVLDVLALTRTPSAGQLCLDGIDARLLEVTHARSGIALLRGADMMHDTLLNNLRLLRPDADLVEVEAVLEAVQLAEVVARLPDGLATQLSPSGLPLSRTQARRVALARALLARPRLLVIDDGLDDLGLPAPAKQRVLDLVLGTDHATTIVIVTADDDVRVRCTRRVLLDRHQLAEVA